MQRFCVQIAGARQIAKHQHFEQGQGTVQSEALTSRAQRTSWCNLQVYKMTGITSAQKV